MTDLGELSRKSSISESDDVPLEVEPPDILLLFSEWLDTEGLMVGESETDQRTHDDLVTEFLQSYYEGRALQND